MNSESEIEKDIYVQWELLLFESARESVKFFRHFWLHGSEQGLDRGVHRIILPVLVINDLFS